MKKKKKRVFVSFIGTNDAGKLVGKSDGAILTALKALKNIAAVHLLWSPTGNFKDTANYLKNEIVKRKLCKNVTHSTFYLDDPSDHNEIYPKLLDYCKTNLSIDSEVIAAIASGTPAMQVCWILMAESGDFKLSLIRSNEPKYNDNPITEIHLGTGLPKVIRLEAENKLLKDLIPKVTLEITDGKLFIGDHEICFSPIQFCYYRYFLERAAINTQFQKFSGLITPNEFLKKIIKYHRESFPEANSYRNSLEKLDKNGYGLTNYTFRSNVTKLNNLLKSELKSNSLYLIFTLKTWGTRTNKHYGLDIPADKIKIH